jgi:hypothetical protein
LNANGETSSTPEAGSADGSSTAPVSGSGRLTLLLIAGIPVTVILAASWMWYFVANGQLDLVGALGTANKGMLVQPPRQVQAVGLRNADGTPWNPQQRERASWTLVIPQASTVCDELCEARLFETRQIHMALGKEMGRVDRALVSPGPELQLAVETLSDGRPVPADFPAYVERDQRGLAVLHGGEASFATLFPELESQPESWYLMDPGGWIMMRYDPSIGYKDVISDLKFLIKNSNG